MLISDWLQVFESNAEYLGPEQFNIFALPYLIKICQGVKSTLESENLEQVTSDEKYLISLIRNYFRFL